jgi:hypothetical protein
MNQPIIVIVSVQLAVDPAMAQSCVNRLRSRERPLRRAPFREAQPKPRRDCALRRKSSVEHASIGEGQDQQTGARFACLQTAFHGVVSLPGTGVS